MQSSRVWLLLANRVGCLASASDLILYIKMFTLLILSCETVRCHLIIRTIRVKYHFWFQNFIIAFAVLSTSMNLCRYAIASSWMSLFYYTQESVTVCSRLGKTKPPQKLRFLPFTIHNERGLVYGLGVVMMYISLWLACLYESVRSQSFHRYLSSETVHRRSVVYVGACECYWLFCDKYRPVGWDEGWHQATNRHSYVWSLQLVGGWLIVSTDVYRIDSWIIMPSWRSTTRPDNFQAGWNVIVTLFQGFILRTIVWTYSKYFFYHLVHGYRSFTNKLLCELLYGNIWLGTNNLISKGSPC